MYLIQSSVEVTILYTARCAEFRTEEGQKRGAEICRNMELTDLLSSVVTDLSQVPQKLANLGINTIGLPGTIDLDIVMYRIYHRI